MPRGLPILTSFFDRFLLEFWSQLGPPELWKKWVSLRENHYFSQNRLFKLTSFFYRFLTPTWVHFASQNPLKSLSKPILKGIDFLIDFDIDFKTAQDGPKTAQDGPRRRSKRQDGPKRPPRRPQDGPMRPQKLAFFSSFFDLGRQEPPRPPRDPSKTDFWSIFGRFLVDFRCILHWFLVDFWFIFRLIFVDRFLPSTIDFHLFLFDFWSIWDGFGVAF